MDRRRLSVLLALLFTLASAAVVGAPAAGRSTAPSPPARCSDTTFEATRFVVCGYDPRRDELRILWRDAAGPVGGFARLEQGLGAAAPGLSFAMNGGMYDPAQAPVGLLVQEGRIVHPADVRTGVGNFYLRPNGVFWTDAAGEAHVAETGRFLAEGAAPAWATQSGPLLLEDGRLHPAIAENGASLAIRNAVGACGRGAAEFVISTDPVSFGRLARLFRDRLGCRDALYLDGAVSSLWAPGLKRRDARTGLGPLIVVSAKAR